MVDEVFVVNALKYSELVRDISKSFVVIRLKGDFLHGHNVAGSAVNGGVDFPKVALP